MPHTILYHINRAHSHLILGVADAIVSICMMIVWALCKLAKHAPLLVCLVVVNRWLSHCAASRSCVDATAMLWVDLVDVWRWLRRTFCARMQGIWGALERSNLGFVAAQATQRLKELEARTSAIKTDASLSDETRGALLACAAEHMQTLETLCRRAREEAAEPVKGATADAAAS